jgi:tRNA G10  N-methylase Trm11
MFTEGRMGIAYALFSIYNNFSHNKKNTFNVRESVCHYQHHGLFIGIHP